MFERVGQPVVGVVPLVVGVVGGAVGFGGEDDVQTADGFVGFDDEASELCGWRGVGCYGLGGVGVVGGEGTKCWGGCNCPVGGAVWSRSC